MLHQQFVSALSEWGTRTLWDEGESYRGQRNTGMPFSVDNNKLIIICRKWQLIYQL